MKIISTLWGLLVDDGRLASILVLAIVVSAVVTNLFQLQLVGAIVIWAGIVVSLFVSIQHQLSLKMRK
ncbi:hypothetical protein [Paenibacillus aceris]|uniref:Uncharacterized protein n=1 Tax=Paenibacillus aceris TaxID=869555 RepID=A0ABS4I857_9BACL|nr:hypothetical protein [Paenibacillus aceris]MBP1967109.1 hypothetical protein [Paenibacillus aceris]NHW35521.1 hypothetical protein [Paenibacillus aceris]